MRRGGIDKVSVVSYQRNKAHEVNDNDGHHANIENWRKEPPNLVKKIEKKLKIRYNYWK